jgi:2-polyprenyl-3-methyl-5-hydroxy-6-metoxy-1,4-benzoquinol methylase
LGIGDFDLIVDDQVPTNQSKSNYMHNHQHEYIRTVQDVCNSLSAKPNARILEVGAFFGVVSIALSKLGFKVTASDVPEYMSLPEQVERYSKYNVDTADVRLQDFVLPFEDNAFEAVIMCEVLEHLNFNPLPLLKEINRILSGDGLFYLSLPNQASINNRLALLRGHSVGVPVESFFNQLNPQMMEIANGHWREYTTTDISTMLTRLDFKIDRQYYFGLSECLDNKSIRKRLGRIFYRLFPQFKENQTTLALKKCPTRIEFSIPATVHPNLRKL